jgi:hypothetical protein
MAMNWIPTTLTVTSTAEKTKNSVEQKLLAMTSRRIGIAMIITDLPTSENSKQK